MLRKIGAALPVLSMRRLNAAWIEDLFGVTPKLTQGIGHALPGTYGFYLMSPISPMFQGNLNT